MQHQCIEFLRVRKQMESQSTCFTGTSKDSQNKCKITSHHIQTAGCQMHQIRITVSQDHMRPFSSAGAMETKQILLVSTQGSFYLQPEGRSSGSAGGRHSGPIWHRGLEWEKGGDFRSITVLCRGSYPIAENSPNNLLKSHLITVHLYRSSCIWSFCQCFWNLCTSDSMLAANIPQRKGG